MKRTIHTPESAEAAMREARRIVRDRYIKNRSVPTRAELSDAILIQALKCSDLCVFRSDDDIDALGGFELECLAGELLIAYGTWVLDNHVVSDGR